MVTLPDFMADTALARLFAREGREGDAAWFSLPGGSLLYAPGEASDHLYFLRTGRLGYMDYQRLENLKADTTMRKGIAGDAPEAGPKA